MRERGPFLLTCSLILLMVPLLSCGSEHTGEERYFLVTTNVKLPYWRSAGNGFIQEAEQWKLRADFVGPDTYDPKAELEEFRKAVQAKPTGILVSAADANLLKDEIDKAIAAGIPVLTIDSDAPSSKRLFFIGTNNYQAGVSGGNRLAKEMQGKGNVVVFTMPEQANLQDRLRGYRDALEAHPQIKITQVIDIKGDPVVAFDTVNQMLGKERDKVNAFVCLEAQAGKEVATVLDNNKVKDKVVIAMDTDPDTLDWIKKGVIAATISQKPYTMANVGLRMLDDLYHHKLPTLDQNWSEDSFSPVPAFVDTGSALIDKNNVAAFQAANQSMNPSKR
jgi:ribose transport system substrate-binding protein